MLTSKEKLKAIKGMKSELSVGSDYNGELLIIIAEELIKMNEYFNEVKDILIKLRR